MGNLDWNENHEKENKHIHASAADLKIADILEKEISLDANAEIAETRREK